MIQEQNIFELESERRNPVLADLFHRMRYMDRRGSGLRKIVNETKKLHGYSDEFLPVFHSTASSFKVVLKNVNYTENKNTDDGEINFGLNFGLNNVQKNIIELLRNNPKTTMADIAETMGMTKRNIENHIGRLKKNGIIEREGAKKNGRWIVK